MNMEKDLRDIAGLEPVEEPVAEREVYGSVEEYDPVLRSHCGETEVWFPQVRGRRGGRVV